MKRPLERVVFFVLLQEIAKGIDKHLKKKYNKS